MNELLTNCPLVSVIVPSFNQGRFIRETIDSILAQDYRPIEILVMDGASRDETLNVLEAYNHAQEVRWWSEPDEGVTDAVNKGMNRVSGKVVAIQSSDDVYLPGAISAAVKFLTAHEDVALVYGHVELMNERSEVIGRDILTSFDLKQYLGRFTYIPQPSAFFRAEMIKEVGGWRKEVSYAPDADFWLRIAVRHNVARLDRLMARYRYHSEQRDTQKSRISRDWEKAVRDLLAAGHLDASTRRFARMGIYLARYRYTAESDWMKRTRYLYQAAAANPRAIFDSNFPRRELLIGRQPIWKFLSQVKRSLGFQPRTSSKSGVHSLRRRLGATVYDLPRFAWAMRPASLCSSGVTPWIYFRNRNERLITGQEQQGVACDWQWTSDLNIARVFPVLGQKLMKRTLRDCPVRLEAEPPPHWDKDVKVSFIIGHRGMERLPHLLVTLRSIAGQQHVPFECLVVEQSMLPEIKEVLPRWVRYVHTPLPYAAMPYCRSWAFNVGARLARGKLLVLHDNDMLLPQVYASELLARCEEGYELVNLKRFIFFLSAEHSRRVFSRNRLDLNEPPESIMQNAQGGGSIAITRDSYLRIGGFDESFIGWGGEDNEFWERAQTRRVWPFGYLPLVHLWHTAQANKFDEARFTAELFEARSAIPPEKRIEELTSRHFGDPQGRSLAHPAAQYS